MSILIYLILGLLSSLLFPPYFFLPLGFLIFPLFCFLLNKNKEKFNSKKFFIDITVFGFGFFISYLFWIKNPFFVFEETKNYFLVFILLILLLSFILGATFTIIFKFGKNIPIVFLIPFMFTVTEYIISILFYGFPWFTLSLIISSNQYLLFSLKSFGTLISSYLIIQLFCLPFIFLSNQKLITELKYLSIFTSLPLIALSILSFYLEKENLKTNKINLEIFQLNFQSNDKIKNAENKLNTIIKYIEESDADLLIFGENNFPYLLEDLDLKIIKDLLNKNQTLIIGATRIDNSKYYNSLINVNPTVVSYFDKKILVPFGEFLPLRDKLTFFENIVGPDNYSKGNQNRIINLSNNISYIPVICYEIVFYWKLLNQINFRSNFIVNITNDFWFGDYLGPYQHLYLTKIRAAEFNKPIIRVSNNGISALIDNNGKILKYTSLNQVEKLKHTLYFKQNNNLIYFHFILKIYFFILFILIIFYYLRRNVKK